MFLNFQQGIITYPATGTQAVDQQFLTRSGFFVNLNASNGRTDVAFAQKDTNYLLTEDATVNGAWGPLPINQDVWLFWDIDTTTGILSRNYTTLEPKFGTTPTPPSTLTYPIIGGTASTIPVTNVFPSLLPNTATFTVFGNQTSTFLTGYTFTVINSTGNNGTYTVAAPGSYINAGYTVIPVVEPVFDSTADGSITLTNTGTFRINGNFTSTFVAGLMFNVSGSTGNDGVYVVSGLNSTFVNGITTINVTQPVKSPVMDGIISHPFVALDDQHWFDTVNKTMNVFLNSRWNNVIRVFAAKVNLSLINPFIPLGNVPNAPFAGSQVALSNLSSFSGRIIYDNAGDPIRRSNGTFFTSEDQFYINGSPANTIKLEANVLTSTAIEPIPAYAVVMTSLIGFNQVELAGYNDLNTTFIGMAMQNGNTNDTITMISQGTVTNPYSISNPTGWNWPTPGAALWVLENGVLVDYDPHTSNNILYPVAKPPIARVITPDTIFFDQGLGGMGPAGPSGFVPLATNAVAGISKLSLAAANPLNPVVVGDNDPRNSDARVPLPHNQAATTIVVTPAGNITATDAQAALQELDTEKVAKAGDTMTGLLILSGDPVALLGAVTKQYVDNLNLNSLTDVTTTSPTPGEILSYNGAQWVNAPAPTPPTPVTPALPFDSIQFNSAGAFGGSSTLTFVPGAVNIVDLSDPLAFLNAFRSMCGTEAALLYSEPTAGGIAGVQVYSNSAVFKNTLPGANVTISTNDNSGAPAGKVIIQGGQTDTGLGGGIDLIVGDGSPDGKISLKSNGIPFAPQLLFYAADAVTYAGLRAAATSDNTIYFLPSADGTSGQLLTTNGAGVLSWTSAAVPSLALDDLTDVTISTITTPLPSQILARDGTGTWINRPRFTVETSTFASPITIDVSDGADEYRLTLTGNTTLNFTGGYDGQRFGLKVTQDGTGGHILTLGTSINIPTSIGTPTFSTGPNVSDRLGFIYDVRFGTLPTGRYDLVAVVTGYATPV